ncbi:hypothetical protein ACFE04_010070 [Oxalis oulophora]
MKTIYVFLVTACIALCTTHGLAQPAVLPVDQALPPLAPFYQIDHKVGTPGNSPIPDDSKFIIPGFDDLTKCLGEFTSVGGCIGEIQRALYSGQLKIVGPECCKAVLRISDKCWPKLFPLTPLFPDVLRNFCGGR